MDRDIQRSLWTRDDGALPWTSRGRQERRPGYLDQQEGQPATGELTGQATLTADQAQQFMAGEWYINIHTPGHPAGEIRGQVMPPKG